MPYFLYKKYKEASSQRKQKNKSCFLYWENKIICVESNEDMKNKANKETTLITKE